MSTEMKAKPVYFSSIQLASAFGITVLLLGVVLKPFDIELPVFTQEQASAICAVGAYVLVMIQRLKPQSPLYFLKQAVEEIAETVEELTDATAPETTTEAPESSEVETKQGENNV